MRLFPALAAPLASARLWFALGLMWAVAQAVASRHSMNPDGMSYIDMATGAPQALVNGYWSPAYPATLAVVLALFHPSAEAVAPLVHGWNVIIFAAVFAAFSFFLRGWLEVESAASRERAFVVPFAYAVALWHTLELVGMASVTPDLWVAGAVFLAAGIVCRLCAGPSGRLRYAALGAALALGYYSKSAMFLFGLTALAGLWMWPPKHVRRAGVVLALAVFLAGSAPLIGALSYRLGRLSIGESGRLAYAWYVNGVPAYTGWTGGGNGSPTHGPRVLMENPRVLEFATPRGGTFPLWYDPVYWNEGVRPRFDLRGQWAVLKDQAIAYGELFRFMNGLTAGAFLLAVLALRDRRPRSPDGAGAPGHRRWLILWPLSALAIYGVIHVEPRLVAPFFVLLWLALYALLAPRVATAGLRIVLASVAGVTLLPSLVVSAVSARTSLADLRRGAQPEDRQIAAGLVQAGLAPGDGIAVVGEAYNAYFTQIAGVRITAQVPDAEAFQRLGATRLGELATRLRAAGVKALVTRQKPASALTGWLPLSAAGTPGLHLLLLDGRREPEALPEAGATLSR